MPDKSINPTHSLETAVINGYSGGFGNYVRPIDTVTVPDSYFQANNRFEAGVNPQETLETTI